MEKLKVIIEEIASKVGGKKVLAEKIGVHPNDLSAVLAEKRGLPPIAQAKLADLTNIPLEQIQAASEIITEKKPEKRAYWEKKLETIAMCGLLALVTNFVTPTPSQAAEIHAKSLTSMYIMLNSRRIVNDLTT